MFFSSGCVSKICSFFCRNLSICGSYKRTSGGLFLDLRRSLDFPLKDTPPRNMAATMNASLTIKVDLPQKLAKKFFGKDSSILVHR